MVSFLPILIILAAYALSLGFTVVIRNLLLKHALLDHPNERSSHAVPVPRGGGWALVLVLVPGILLTAYLQNSTAQYATLIVGIIVLVLISSIDDSFSSKGGVSAGVRLSAHLLAACIGSLVFMPQETIFGGALPFWLDRTIMIVGWAWFMNLYNFMDGIDGITGVESICVSTGVCMLMLAAHTTEPFADTLTLLVSGASLGFLALNWHPAKIFLGDVGSVMLGYLVGFLLLSLAVKGQLVPALILPLYYLADSGITLAKRILRGDKFWQAHREHYYQRAALTVSCHRKVVYWILIANIALIGAALMAVHNLVAGIVCAIGIVAILLWKMHKSAVNKG